MASTNDMVIPEEVSGRGLGGRAYMSADMWVHEDAVPNADALIEVATVYKQDSRTGKVEVIRLARRVGEYVVMPRHLFPDWSSALGEYEEIKVTFDTEEFVDNIVPRNPEQEKAWEAMDGATHGILNLACGKGKTVMALKKIARRNHPAIVIVNNTGLVEQWIDRAQQFLGLDRSQIGLVQQKKAEWDKPLVIAMIHTLAKRAPDLPSEIRKRFGTIVFDEVHHLSAATFVKTANLFYGARYGLTATAKREDGLEDVYYAHVGRIFFSDLVGEHKAKVFFKKVSTRVDLTLPDVTDVRGEWCAGKFYQHLGKIRSRNLEIMHEVKRGLEGGRKILVLTHPAKHPKILDGMFREDNISSKYKSGWVSGETSGAKRTEIIEESDVTFATFQVAKEGLDVAALDTVLFVTPFKAWGSLQQGKGRIERTHPGKKDPVVIIFEDYLIPPAAAMCAKLKRSLKLNGHTYTVYQR